MPVKESLGPPQDQGSPSGTHRYITGALARNRGESGEQSYLWFVYIRDQIKSQVVPDNPVKTGWNSQEKQDPDRVRNGGRGWAAVSIGVSKPDAA